MLKCSDKSTFGSSPVSQCLRQNHCSFRLEKLFAPTFGCVHCVLVCYVYGLLSSSAVFKFQIRQNIFHLLEKNIFLAGVTLVFCYPSRGHYVLHPVAFFPVFFHCFDRKSMVIYIAHRANIPMVFRHRAEQRTSYASAKSGRRSSRGWRIFYYSAPEIIAHCPGHSRRKAMHMLPEHTHPITRFHSLTLFEYQGGPRCYIHNRN